MLAIILAGGKGTRLLPYTITIPKPLVPIKKTPIIELLIKSLIKEGVKKFAICTNYLGNYVESFISSLKLNVDIKYSMEKKFFGTVGPLKLLKKLPNNFLICNGDIISNINYKKIFEEHLKSKSMLTVGITSREMKIDYGILEISKISRSIIEFREKPIQKYYVSMGIYVMNKELLKYIPKKKFGFDKLIKLCIKKKIKLNYFHHKGKWLDIGRVEDYEKANSLF
jgi:NDP-sugar pyrophosphorylase family protein